jgi:hypothetical protein
MKKIILSLLVIAIAMSSCNKSLFVSNGSKDNRPLLFQNEYEFKTLNEITVEGEAICGIPSFIKNNKNNHNHGMLFTFNGVDLGSVKRFLPIVTMLGFSYATGALIQTLGGKEQVAVNPYYPSYKIEGDYKIKKAPAMLLGLPIAGILNNLLWSGSSLSGATSTLNYRLVTENPTIDLFFYPKYEIQYKPKLFTQSAIIKARVTGATLKKK